MTAIGKAPLYVDDDPRISVDDIAATARKLKARVRGLGVVIVDDIQVLAERAAPEQRFVAIGDVCRGLKVLARDLAVPVVAVTGVSRKVEGRADKRPMMSDLFGAGEEHADVVLFVYREEYYSAESAHEGEADVIVAKNSDGPRGTTRLLFQDRYVRFDNAARQAS